MVTERERITRLRAKLALPLFVKELTEASARRRTYVVRTLYAGALFLLAVLFARDVLFPTGEAFAVLGRGGELFGTVMLIQFGGVYLFLPALTAASITAEKERNTLGLLLLTKLSPTKIVLEKFLSRVFPMLCLAALSLPLLGVAYTLGGLDFPMLFEGVARLVATILMIGAIGVACSAWCRTTAGAFLSTYAILALMTLGPVLFVESLGIRRNDTIITIISEALDAVRLIPSSDPDAVVGIFLGPLPVIEWMQAANQRMAGFGTAFVSKSPWLSLWQTMPLLLPAVVSLVAARLVLVRRAEVKPKRYLARAFAALDRKFREWNDRYAKGIEVIKTRGSLPDYSPVAWRETTKTTLGSFRSLVRLLLLVETPVLFIAVAGAGDYNAYSAGMLGLIAGLLWLGSGLLVAAKGSGLFAGERAKQTLDVLLATPLPTRRILREKLAGVWRLIFVAAVPLMTAFLLIAYMRYAVTGVITAAGALYVAAASSVTVTHLALTAYLSLLVGLRVPTQSRAVLTSVAVLTALCLAGPIAHMVAAAGQSYQQPDRLLSLYSPATVVGELMDMQATETELFALFFGNTVIYGGLALLLRWACYHYARDWLGRDENELAAPILERVGTGPVRPVENRETAMEVVG
jgi:ABC-type transport system involved in multi-copper enzyme maturation permease subunit